MAKFGVLVHGVNFWIQDDNCDGAELRGFYVSAFLEADRAEDAESVAIELGRKSLRTKITLTNPANDPPRLLIDKLAELTGWPDRCTRPLSGFAFYCDPDEVL